MTLAPIAHSLRIHFRSSILHTVLVIIEKAVWISSTAMEVLRQICDMYLMK